MFGLCGTQVDTMANTPRPTRAEATDVANAVLDGVDGILLGAETLRGLYPVETVSLLAPQSTARLFTVEPLPCKQEAEVMPGCGRCARWWALRSKERKTLTTSRTLSSSWKRLWTRPRCAPQLLRCLELAAVWPLLLSRAGSLPSR